MLRKPALLALVLVLIIPATAGGFWFKASSETKSGAMCPEYGYKCYRPYTTFASGGFVDDLWSAKGEYVGSVRVEEGLRGFWGFTCRPDGMDKSEAPEPAMVCNERFPECEGDCFAK